MHKDMELREVVEKCNEVLRSGGVILYPTDTIWGIGCDATNAEAVKRVYEIKRREDSKAMIVLVANTNEMWKYVESVPDIAEQLFEAAEAKGSKPLTVVMEGGCAVASNLLPEQKTIAIRIPQHDFCQGLLRKFRRAVVSTSANISGESSPTKFSDISQEIINAVDFVVPAEFEKGSTRSASSIVSVGKSGEVAVLRP